MEPEIHARSSSSKPHLTSPSLSAQTAHGAASSPGSAAAPAHKPPPAAMNPSSAAQLQPKSPLTFDDLVPLLTSQHRTASDNSSGDALMQLFDAYARHGAGTSSPHFGQLLCGCVLFGMRLEPLELMDVLPPACAYTQRHCGLANNCAGYAWCRRCPQLQAAAASGPSPATAPTSVAPSCG